MRKEYKILSVIFVLFVVTINSFCLATDTGITEKDEQQEEDIYIGSYEEYENLFSEAGNGYSQEELKDYYQEYKTQIKDYFNAYTREETVKAKVLEVSEVEAQYEYNEYYYSVSKYEYQPIVIEILEGEHSGKKFNVNYLLTGDSLNNITYSKLKAGDKIFVAVMEDQSTGEIYADITNTGSNVDRFSIVLCLAIFTLLILIVYAGKKGVLISLITILILDFCLVIIPNMGFAGNGFILGAFVFVLVLIGLISLYEIGFNKKALKGFAISLIVVFFAVLLLAAGNYLTRTSGVVFEVSALSENVILSNMNFEHLYFIITMMIVSAVATKVVCETIKTMENSSAKTFEEKLALCRDIVASNVITITVILFATYIPNHLLLLTNKYTPNEIWNSEILISELIRLFVVIISISLAAPTTIAITDKKKK